MQRQIKILAGFLVIAALMAGGCQLVMPSQVDQGMVAT